MNAFGKYKRWMRSLTFLLLFTFSFSFGFPTHFIMAGYQLKQFHAPTAFAASSGSNGESFRTELSRLAQELDALYDQIQSDIEKEDLKAIKETLKQIQKTLKDSRLKVDNEFDRQAERLSRIKAQNALKRQARFQDQLDQGFSDLEAQIKALQQLVSRGNSFQQLDEEAIRLALGEIRDLMKPETPEFPMGNKLPHRNLATEPQSPDASVSTTSEIESMSLPDQPGSEDLAETPETRVTDAIRQLADSLGDDPQALYEYVRNHIEFEPYYGSRKGAQGTLDQKEGNDYDQASLLIALLRYHDIPARYVRGVVEVPVEQAMNWAGAETPEAAIRVLGSAGIPVTGVVSQGKVTAVRMEHVWAEAYVPYENYRGQGERTGTHVWVPLDPSFKQYTEKEGLDFQQFGEINQDTIFRAMNDSARSGDGLSTAYVNMQSIQQQVLQAVDELETYVQDNDLAGAPLEELIGGRDIVEENLGLLPLSLPYEIVEVSDEFREVPDALSDRIGFRISGADPFGFQFYGEADFEYQARAVDLYGKRLTLSWVPATQEDEDIIEEYGGLFQTPAYLVQVKPVIKADGEVIAEGQPVGLGYNQQFTIDMQSAGKTPEQVVNPVTTGSFYAIIFNYGKISAGELNEIQAGIEQLQGTVTEENLYTDEAMGEILNAAGKAYFAQLDVTDQIIAQQYDVEATPLLKEAMTGYRVNVSYMFMSPVQINAGGLFIDVDHNVYSVVSQTGQDDDRVAFMLASGMIASAMEHGIYEQLIGVPSVSAIKILEEANNRGVPLYTVTSGNVQEILPELSVSSTVKTDISNAVNQGRIVLIPEHNIQYYDWNGAGYIVLDPDTGAAGYMISGGIAGGSSSLIVTLAALIAVIDTIIMILSSLSLLAAGTIVGAIFGIALLALAIAFAVQLTNLMIDYYIYGDTAAGQAIIGEALLSIIGAIGGSVLAKVIPGLSRFLDDAYQAVKNALKHTDIAEQLAKDYSDDFVDSLVRHSGTDVLEEASDIVRGLERSGVSKDLIEEVGHSAGKEGLEQLQNLVNKGLNESQIRQILDSKIGLDDASRLADSQILPEQYLDYGIRNGTEARAVSDLLDNGLSKEAIETITGNGVKPSYFEKLGVDTVEGATKYIDDLNNGQRIADLTGDVVKYPDGNVWDLDHFTRGKEIDELLGNNLGDNFPVIDKYDPDSRIITSIKSYNPSLKSHQGSQFYSNIKRDIDKLNEFKDAYWNDIDINPNLYDTKTLQIALPDVKLTGTQVDSLNRAIDYARGLKIDVVITVVN
ncbi:MAG: hypothetical protein H0Z33_06585 [Bacillaceae bacterium]|nr:hypothetical protein [Bacillaceae bacterium]